MVGMKEFCALLLAGGMGAGSMVAVQQAKPGHTRPKAKAAKPKVHKSAQRAVQQTRLGDCPVPVASLGDGAGSLAPFAGSDQLFPLTGGSLGGVGSPDGGGWGGGGGGISGPEILPIHPVVPGVPQPDTWVMLVAGFGFIGLALRRSPTGLREVGRHSAFLGRSSGRKGTSLVTICPVPTNDHYHLPSGT